MNAVGIDVSIGKSMMAIMRPFGEIVSTPFEIKHTNNNSSSLIELIKNFDNDSLPKLKPGKADTVKIARYALDKWQNLKQYSVMDELLNQLKTMNRQFGFLHKA